MAKQEDPKAKRASKIARDKALKSVSYNGKKSEKNKGRRGGTSHIANAR